jgi:hypothetical protein
MNKSACWLFGGGLAGIATVLIVAGWGCGGISPIANLTLLNNAVSDPSVQTFPRGGIVRPTTTTTVPVNPTINTTCDLTSARKVITMLLRNNSVLSARYSVTFLASTGTGGFVCAADVPTYTAAGYVSVGSNITLGCDTLNASAASGFRGGTELLAWTVTSPIPIPPNTTGNENQAPAAPAPLNGVTVIPLPEVIVLGDGTPTFICTLNDPCSQGGLAYTDAGGITIELITASRTQGTLCRTGLGTRPEWRLLNPNSADATAQAFQYVAGSSISVTVLNRAFNPDPAQNKAVWRVIGPPPGFTLIHAPQ